MKQSRDWVAKTTGFRTNRDVGEAFTKGKFKGQESGIQQGYKEFGDKAPTSDVMSAAGTRGTKIAAGGIAKGGEAVGSAISRGSKALSQAAQDNPGGLGVAAAGAGLGALALKKLMGRRKQVS